jgi:hypothetical protein
MYFRQLAKIRTLIEYQAKKDTFDTIANPAHYAQHNKKNVSRFFYHKTVGELLFSGALLRFLNDKLHLKQNAAEFEYYFTAFNNTSLFMEVADYLDLLAQIKFMPSFLAKLTKKEIAALKKEYYFAYLSLLEEDGHLKEISILTEGFFIHYFFNITFPTPVKRNVNDWCKSVIVAQYGSLGALKESVHTAEDNVNFCLIVDGKKLVDLNGGSIKTLRANAYKKLLIILLE